MCTQMALSILLSRVKFAGRPGGCSATAAAVLAGWLAFGAEGRSAVCSEMCGSSARVEGGAARWAYAPLKNGPVYATVQDLDPIWDGTLKSLKSPHSCNIPVDSLAVPVFENPM